MKTFKKLLIFCLIFLIPFGFLYLCVSFVCADFNFVNWGEIIRFVAIVVASAVSFFSLYCFFN
jgi:hypothetical protein